MNDRPLPAAARRFVGLVVALALAAATALAVTGGGDVPGDVAWLVLPVLVVLHVTATFLVVRFRPGSVRGGADDVDLAEAVLALLLFAFPAPAVLGAVAVAYLVLGALRRAAAIKTAFNMAQFTLAASVAHVVLVAVSDGREGLTPHTVVALLLALVAAAVVNNLLFTGVLVASTGRSPRQVLSDLAPVIVPGWLGGFGVNAAVGLLFVLAYVTTPVATLLFFVPLALLHVAYRGYVVARTDRSRLTGLHAAAQSLAAPLDPHDGIPAYLRLVASTFEAGAVDLVLRTESGREVHSYDAPTDEVRVHAEPDDAATVHGALAAQPGPVRLLARGSSELEQALGRSGRTVCLAAPLREQDRLLGAVAVYDQAGFASGDPGGELAVLDALARETASAFAKGRLLAAVLEERRKLAEVVDTTSDGILSIAADGTVRSWNPALEAITGLSARAAVGSTSLAALQLRRASGEAVDLATWAAQGVAAIPTELVLTAVDGTTRQLTCSASTSEDDAESGVLVLVARDVTPAQEAARLRQQFDALVQQQAAQRLVVDHLQQAVMPNRPDVTGAELAVVYEPSDPASPTGGDLYDWHQLPTGELHLAVVDVLGHGVEATKDALAVVHTLRLVAVDGTPLQDIVARADALLGAQYPDLVATVVIGRFDPRSGRLQVVTGGHPPALLVTPRGQVEQLAPGGGAIGWPGAGSDGIVELVMQPGDALVLYTDGLVEARKDILEGLEHLVRSAAELAGRPADDLARGLLERSLQNAERRDDSLALVLRRAPIPATENRTSWRLGPARQEAASARRALTAWLHERSVPVGDLGVVASELLANAVRAARSSVVLTVRLEEDAVLLEVTDDGKGTPGLERVGTDLPSYDDEHGRGLFLVRAMTDHVEVLSTSEGSVVRTRTQRAPLHAPAPRTGVEALDL